MTEIKRGPASDLSVVVSWLGFLWCIFILDTILRSVFGIWLANWGGLKPREIDGLVGIITAHALHANLPHILANSFSLLILGWVSCGYSRSLTGVAVIYSMLFAGIFTWCFGSWNHPGAVHVGASSIVFGLIGWLVANGIFRRGCLPLILGFLIFLLYGGALIGALPPPPDENGQVAPISWEMHLGGLFGGIMASWHLRKERIN
jgi:membrane associated rhomboid family serine protease